MKAWIYHVKGMILAAGTSSQSATKNYLKLVNQGVIEDKLEPFLVQAQVHEKRISDISGRSKWNKLPQRNDR